MQTETPRVDNRPGAVNGPIPGLARKARSDISWKARSDISIIVYNHSYRQCKCGALYHQRGVRPGL